MILVPEDKEMLKTFLDSYLFNNKNSEKNIGSNAEIELIVRPECNQKCEYCYITKYGKDLYPVEKRIDNIQILNNIKILLDYLYENKCFVKNWELFAGDLFYDDLFFDIAEIFYNYFKKIKNNYPEIYENLDNFTNDENHYRNSRMNCITMPCNFSFCHNEEKKEHFAYIFEKLMSVNTVIALSYSTDGLYAIDTREKRNNVTQEFYDKTFEFCKEFGFGCHPMIAPENIDNAIKNYQWWREMYQKYFSETNEIIPCMLEVRNDGWTQEKINTYIDFLNYALEDRIKVYNNDLTLMTRQLFSSSDSTLDRSKPHGPISMDPIMLQVKTKDQNRISCTLGHSLCINCANLSLVPCHRLAYSFFQGGQFKVENNKIIDIEPFESINAYLNQMFINEIYEVKCQTCENKFFCLQGCHGSQFETNGDPNIPINSVCNLLTAKIDFLLKKYHELGIFKILFTDEVCNCHGIARNRYIDILVKKGYKEYEQYREQNK